MPMSQAAATALHTVYYDQHGHTRAQATGDLTDLFNPLLTLYNGAQAQWEAAPTHTHWFALASVTADVLYRIDPTLATLYKVRRNTPSLFDTDKAEQIIEQVTIGHDFGILTLEVQQLKEVAKYLIEQA